MDVNALLLEAGNLMLIGMVVVFVFLTLLIGCINLMAKLVKSFSPEKVTCDTPVPATAAGQPSGAVVAAISAAVSQYRQSRQQ